ncbi:MAG: hypothetical protein AAGF01_15155 [Cyanobacteria bacterium P01_G01_bin.38]
MKRHFLTALALTVATVAVAPIANAAEFEATNLQQRRYEVLNRGGSKAIDNIQSARLEHFDNQSKAVEDIQSTRLEALDARSKSNVHTLRLEHLDTQSKAIENLQSARLEALDSRSKQQVSTPAEISEDATFHDLIRFNRRERNKS